MKRWELKTDCPDRWRYLRLAFELILLALLIYGAWELGALKGG